MSITRKRASHREEGTYVEAWEYNINGDFVGHAHIPKYGPGPDDWHMQPLCTLVAPPDELDGYNIKWDSNNEEWVIAENQLAKPNFDHLNDRDWEELEPGFVEDMKNNKMFKQLVDHFHDRGKIETKKVADLDAKTEAGVKARKDKEKAKKEEDKMMKDAKAVIDGIIASQEYKSKVNK
jgi:Asp-tRNA(Asn)/Glu-tRNA(Gln) amidotransferase C subunit